MTNPFENIFDTQKKAYEYWADMSKKAMSGFTTNGQKTDTPADLLNEYYDRQKTFFEDLSKVSDPKEAFIKSPDNFKKWMDVQTEFADRWLKMYKDNAEKIGAKIPDWSKETEGVTKNWEKGLNEWSAWVQKSNDWIKENIMAKMPPVMQDHYKNYATSYADLYKNWESFTKMMQFGVNQKEMIDKYFSPDAYKNFIDKFMGFKGFGDVNETLNTANKYFDDYIAAMSKYAPSAADMSAQWEKNLENLASSDLSPLFKTAISMNEQLRQELAPYMNMMGDSKEVKAVKILKDIQFAYIAYILKTADMQTKVYQAGSVALPEVLKKYYESYRATNDLPDYKTFYTQYINELEACITKVLESDEYSVLQNDVAKTGITVKAKNEELIELLFSDMPFLMKSQGDDIALELSTLRQKIRNLEHKISAWETPSVADEVTQPKVYQTKRTVLVETPKTTVTPPSATSEVTADDLKKIEGIGPKIESLLQTAGIKTFLELSKSNAAFIKKILDEAGSRFRMHDPSTWIEQAAFAAKGDWTKLAAWQEELKAGKQVA